MQWVLVVGFLNALFWRSSLQCYCPQQYTQNAICSANLIIKATIDSIDNDRDPRNRIFGITIDEIIYGESTLQFVSDRSILSTPKSTAECGPLNLQIGETYIITPSTYGGRMTANVCQYVERVKELSETTLKRITSEYKQHCDCKIPVGYYMPAPPHGRRSKDSCGAPPSDCNGWNSLCKRDPYGRCYWSSC